MHPRRERLLLASGRVQQYKSRMTGKPSKIVAVTGGAQGIGRAVALHFAAACYAVSVADPAADAGAEIGELLRERGVQALVRTTDVADEAAVADWMRQTVEALGWASHEEGAAEVRASIERFRQTLGNF